jgi:hypothetical protein
MVEDADTPEVTNQQLQMQLVSVMVIPPNSGVARIRVLNDGGAAARRAAASRSRSRTAAPMPSAAGREDTQTYNIGDKLQETEYLLKEIHFDHVVLERGDEQRILKVDPEDEGSVTRKTAAATPTPVTKDASTGAERVQVVMAPQQPAASSASSPPPPPPPPVMMSGPGGLPVVTPQPAAASDATGTVQVDDATSREERRNRALEARRRLLEERRAQTQK